IGEVNLPGGGGTQLPSAITSGPDGNIWFTESVPSGGGAGSVSAAVGGIKAARRTFAREFVIPAALQPSGITAGPDGNVWFTEKAAGAIGFVTVAGQSDPSGYSLGTAIPIPTSGQPGGVLAHPAPVGITSAQNQVWFADASGAIGAVTLTH